MCEKLLPQAHLQPNWGEEPVVIYTVSVFLVVQSEFVVTHGEDMQLQQYLGMEWREDADEMALIHTVFMFSGPQ